MMHPVEPTSIWKHCLLLLNTSGIACCCLVTKQHLTLWLLCPWDFPGKNAGVGCHFLLQGICPTQESNPHLSCLPYWQADSPPLQHLGGHQDDTVQFSAVAQACPTLCDPMNCSSSVHGIFQARILGWVAISFSRGSAQPRD